jgi:sulfatase maturation enzyme AslB (radical SAM superfamily)
MLKDSFCSSPWFHIRLTYDGSYDVCRWSKNGPTDVNIKTTSLMQFYNSEPMRTLRTQLLAGERPHACEACYYQDSFNKLSGRVRQLNKSAINLTEFPLSFRSSPHLPVFEYSADMQGASSHFPTDLQIDLGNTCNSACIMCDPTASSRLVADYKKLNKLDSRLFANPVPYRSWTEDRKTVDRFVQELQTFPYLRYIHFLGGETLYNQAFYDICEHLNGTDLIVGTTTNGTIYDQRIEQLIPQFKEFHLGISIESVTDLNDYVRYPGPTKQILENIKKFVDLRDQYPGLKLELRITPNLFTISELDQVFEFMIKHDIIAESCNILHQPRCLRMELMPEDIRQETVIKLQAVVDKLGKYTPQINTRRSDLSHEIIAQLANEYLEFVKTYTTPNDVEESTTELVRFLKSFETIRNNKILDYAPRYKEFLQRIGY